MENKHLITTFVDGKGTFSFQIKLSEKKRIDKETGYLYCDEAIFGHTGVQEYYGHELPKKLGEEPNKIVKVHRMADEVFRDETMASFEGKSITVLHPTEAVTSKNYKQYDVGTILKVWRDGDNVVGNIVVKDMDTIEMILEKRMESLSLGYVAKIEKIAESEYQQKNILINHLAIVAKGRAKNARILDEAKKESRPMGFLNFLFGKKIKVNEDDTITVFDSDEKSLENKEVKTKEDKTKIDDALFVNKSKTTIEETNTYDDETGETKTERKVHEESTRKVEADKLKQTHDNDLDTQKEQENLNDELIVTQKNENKEKEEGEIEMSDEMKKALKDELMAEVLKEIKESPEFKNSVFKDVVIKQTDSNDEQTSPKLGLNFEKDEKLRKTYYDMLTNPLAHNGSWKEFNQFRKTAERKPII